MATPESIILKQILTDRDQKLVKKLLKDEQRRFIDLIYNLILGSVVLWLGTISFAGAGDRQALFIAFWLIGIFVIFRGIYECFFNHRRRLILKLTNAHKTDQESADTADRRRGGAGSKV